MRKSLIVLGAFLVIAFSTGSNCHHGITNPNEPTPPFEPTNGPTTPTSVPSTPTAAPTTAATKAPTSAPTVAPTTAATKAPTSAPTVAPTTVPTAGPTPGTGDPAIDNTGDLTVSKGGSFDVFGVNLGGCASTWKLVSGTNGFPLVCQFGDNFSVQLQLPSTSSITPGGYKARVTRTDSKTADSPFNVTVK